VGDRNTKSTVIIKKIAPKSRYPDLEVNIGKEKNHTARCVAEIILVAFSSLFILRQVFTYLCSKASVFNRPLFTRTGSAALTRNVTGSSVTGAVGWSKCATVSSTDYGYGLPR